MPARVLSAVTHDWLDELKVVKTKSSGLVHAARIRREKCAHGESGHVVSECGLLRTSLDRVVVYEENPPLVQCGGCRKNLRRWAEWRRDEAKVLRAQAERAEHKADQLLVLLGKEIAGVA